MCYSIDFNLILLGVELVITGLYTLYIPFEKQHLGKWRDLKQNPSHIPLIAKNFQFRSNYLAGDFVWKLVTELLAAYYLFYILIYFVV